MNLLDQFEQYLIDRGYKQFTPRGAKSTTYDYAKIRIPFALKEESISVHHLYDQIENI